MELNLVYEYDVIDERIRKQKLIRIGILWNIHLRKNKGKELLYKEEISILEQKQGNE